MLSRFIAQRILRLEPEARSRWQTRWWVCRPVGFLLVPVAMWSVAQVSVVRALDWPLVFWLWPWLHAFTTLALVDFLIGTEEPAPDEAHAGVPRFWEPVLRWIPLLALPVHGTVVVLGARLAATNPFMDGPDRLAWMLSCGLCGGLLAGIPAHELIHRRARWERSAGGLLLSLIGYGTFKVEHVRGHHVDVGTPADPSSAPRGRSIYRFVPEAAGRNAAKAWRLEASRLRASGHSPWSLRNEVVGWTAATVAIALGLGVAWGPIAMAFFLVQAAVAIWILESANYIEHYGLRRRQLPDGRYERTGAVHSWDAAYVASGWLFINLPKHAQHHLRATVPYYRLAPMPDAPRLPGGYTAMVLLAHLPPLWRRIIDPRIPPTAAGEGEPR